MKIFNTRGCSFISMEKVGVALLRPLPPPPFYFADVEYVLAARISSKMLPASCNAPVKYTFSTFAELKLGTLLISAAFPTFPISKFYKPVRSTLLTPRQSIFKNYTNTLEREAQLAATTSDPIEKFRSLRSG